MRFFIFLSFTFAAIAQTNYPAGIIGGVFTQTPARVAVMGGFISPSGLPGNNISGAPYSADQITEHVQTLADGTHITQPTQKTKLYRDSQGRTRIERAFPRPPGVAPDPAGDGPNIIEIADPANGVRYSLDTRGHTAQKSALPALRPAKLPATANTPAAPASRVARILPAPVPVPPQPDAAASAALRPQISHESLGPQTIEGLLAEGTRTTVVYPIGSIGNDRPLTTVSETWTSSELKMVILSKNSDPRTGETTMRLTNVSRAEPDPSMFQVPPDYQVIDPEAERGLGN